MKTYILAIGLALGAHGVMAQDWGGAPGLNPYATDWSGAYAGLHATALSAHSQYRSAHYEIATANGAGLQLGYMRDYGHLVSGAEIAYSAHRITHEGVETDSGYLQLKGRIGRDTGVFMPYLTAGVGRLSESGQREDSVIFGLGVLVAANDDLILGFEYSRNHFADVLEADVGSGLDLNLDMFQLTASLRF